MNKAVKQGVGTVSPAAAASVAGVTPAPAAGTPLCPKCKDTHRVIFVEKKRGLKSVGPCDCVKA